MRYVFAALLLTCAAAGAQPADTPLPPASQTVDADRGLAESAAQQAGSKDAAANREIARGWQQLKQGDAEVAIQSFNQAYLLNPNHPEVYWGLGVAMSQQGKHDLAARLFRRALTLAPDNPKLLADVGLAHTRAAVAATQDPVIQAKRLQGVMPWFDAAEKLDPSYPLTYVHRARTLVLLGNHAEAWVNIEKAEAIDRNSVDQKLIADLSARLPRPTSAPLPAPAAASATAASVKTEAVAAPAEVQQQALPAPQPAPQASPPVQADDKPTASATAPQSHAEKTATSEPRTLRVISAEPKNPKGPDKRACLDLPTNEAVMRCVYPRK